MKTQRGHDEDTGMWIRRRKSLRKSFYFEKRKEYTVKRIQHIVFLSCRVTTCLSISCVFISFYLASLAFLTNQYTMWSLLEDEVIGGEWKSDSVGLHPPCLSHIFLDGFVQHVQIRLQYTNVFSDLLCSETSSSILLQPSGRMWRNLRALMLTRRNAAAGISAPAFYFFPEDEQEK